MLPTSGSFYLLDKDQKLDTVKKKIGVLPDYSTFYDSMTPFDHLSYFCKVSGFKVSKKKINETLELVGLSNDREKKVGKFSFGMKKKLGIAQAIINDPDLIFLDEPTSGVDAESAIQIKNLIISLQKTGKTIFMTSHNLNEIENVCTRVAIMKDGKIQSEGTIQELKNKYKSTKTVKIRIQEHISESTKKDIEKFLENNSKDYNWEKSYLIIDIDNQNFIPIILRLLMKMSIDIFEVITLEPSLEEIFLDKNIAI